MERSTFEVHAITRQNQSEIVGMLLQVAGLLEEQEILGSTVSSILGFLRGEFDACPNSCLKEDRLVGTLSLEF